MPRGSSAAPSPRLCINVEVLDVLKLICPSASSAWLIRPSKRALPPAASKRAVTGVSLPAIKSRALPTVPSRLNAAPPRKPLSLSVTGPASSGIESATSSPVSFSRVPARRSSIKTVPPVTVARARLKGVTPVLPSLAPAASVLSPKAQLTRPSLAVIRLISGETSSTRRISISRLSAAAAPTPILSASALSKGAASHSGPAICTGPVFTPNTGQTLNPISPEIKTSRPSALDISALATLAIRSFGKSMRPAAANPTNKNTAIKIQRKNRM